MLRAKHSEISVTLYPEGFLDETALLRLAQTVDQHLEKCSGWRIVLDCTQVTGFSGPALALLAGLIQSVRKQACELVLIHMATPIRAAIVDTLVDSYLPPAQATAVRNLLGTARTLSHSARYSPSPTVGTN